jgi:hypothetical protein
LKRSMGLVELGQQVGLSASFLSHWRLDGSFRRSETCPVSPWCLKRTSPTF